MHGTRSKRPAVKHYLLTLPHAHLHAYLMVDDARYVRDTADRLVAEAKRLGFNHPLMSVVLATPIGEDAGIVRETGPPMLKVFDGDDVEPESDSEPPQAA